MYTGKENFFQRWDWSEKRRRKNHSNISRKNIVQSTRRPPLGWSSTSLTCHLTSRHNSNRTCMKKIWNWSNTNNSTILFDDNKQILFHPRVSSSTQVILADRPLPSYGKSYWEIYMPAVYGTSIMFGISTNKQKLISSNFENLIGIDEHGWGLSHHGLLWHNGISRSYLTKSFDLLQPVLIGLEFDSDARTLSYTINNQSMGVAFHSIPRNHPIYPAVSSTSAQSTMILQHSCQICSSLREICVKNIKSKMSIKNFNSLSLPHHLIKQILTVN